MNTKDRQIRALLDAKEPCLVITYEGPELQMYGDQALLGVLLDEIEENRLKQVKEVS
jgi:hypothetical protein